MAPPHMSFATMPYYAPYAVDCQFSDVAQHIDIDIDGLRLFAVMPHAELFAIIIYAIFVTPRRRTPRCHYTDYF